MKQAILIVNDNRNPRKIAGLTCVERLTRSFEKLGNPVTPVAELSFQMEQGARTDVLVVEAERVFDLELLEAALESKEPFSFSDGTPPRAVGLARIPAAQVTALIHLEEDRAYVEWSECEGTLPTRPVEALLRYEKNMRKYVRPRALDPRETPEREIENHLLASAGKGTNDFVARYLHVAPQNRITRLLWRYPGVTPNLITIANLLLSVASVYAFCTDRFLWGALGCNLNGLIDGVDGKLARTTLRYTRLGNVLDHGGDQISDFFWYLSIAWGLRNHTGLPMSAFSLAGLLVFFYFLDRSTTGFFAARHSVELHDYRRFDRIVRLMGARRNNSFFLLLLGGMAGSFSLTYVLLLPYTGVTAFVKMLRFAWIEIRGLESDVFNYRSA